MKRARAWKLLASLCVLSLAGAGVAYATIPGSNGTINGCYEKRTGVLRVLDAEAGAKCLSIETPVSWNQKGERGLQGPQGAPGERGEKGDKGDPGAPGPAYTAGRGLELNGTELRLSFDPAEIAQLRQQVAQLQTGFNELEKQNSAHTSQLETLVAQLAGQSGQLAALGGKVDGVKVDLNTLRDVLSGTMAGLQANLDALRLQFDETKARLDSLKAWACGIDPKGAPC